VLRSARYLMVCLSVAVAVEPGLEQSGRQVWGALAARLAALAVLLELRLVGLARLARLA